MPVSRIDKLTVQRIIDTADIVEVVSDFVKLKRSGSGYIGLCPFHNDRTPSFKVSKAKNICKCFACNQGGSPVNFIMLHEKLSYQEALRYLAKKYGIEIKEHELTDKERAEESERESLLGVNEFALECFENYLHNTDEGRNVGLAYFRHRGISDAMIERFRLGYSLENPTAFSELAVTKGYNPELLVKAGLSYHQNNTGTLRDRFCGRVIYPVFKVSGKVVAFGGRTLKSGKVMAKYVNSPESIIYSKSNELYGLYQSKGAIARKGKCILVEGYMDVISMHQAGVENVVASSGTALTRGQVRLIRRFAENVTVIYDSDAAGIKASLRSIDILLSEGLNIKVLQLPEGEDPDSFAQSHNSTEVEEYLAQHEIDFIRFKTNILLADAADDPTRRAGVISDIVRSISVIPDQIKRNVYIEECSRLLGIGDKVLLSEMTRMRANAARERERDNERERARATIGDIDNEPETEDTSTGADSAATSVPPRAESTGTELPVMDTETAKFLQAPETELIRYVVRYGMVPFCDSTDPDTGEPTGGTMSVAEYVDYELKADELTLTTPGLTEILERTLLLYRTQWPADLAAEEQQAAARRAQGMADGIEHIRETAEDLTAITAAETALTEQLDAAYYSEIDEYTCAYAGRHLLNDADDRVRNISTDLFGERYQLSKIHSRYAHVETERERIDRLIPRAIHVLKNAWVELRILRLNNEIRNLTSQPGDNSDRIIDLMTQLTEQNEIKRLLAREIGDRIFPQPR